VPAELEPRPVRPGKGRSRRGFHFGADCHGPVQFRGSDQNGPVCSPQREHHGPEEILRVPEALSAVFQAQDVLHPP